MLGDDTETALAFPVVMPIGTDSFPPFWSEILFEGKLLIIKGLHSPKETQEHIFL